MPTYEITNNTTGKKYDITADRPPTGSEVEEIFFKSGETKTKEGIGAFLKSAANATGIPKFIKNAAAAAETVGSMATMKINPELSSEFADRALKNRIDTGTTGSIDQGLGATAKTAFNVAAPAIKTALTATGLATVAPATIAKLALGGGVVGGGISKLSGGTFSEGAGSGVGSAPSTAAVLQILSKIKAVRAAGKITKETLSPVKEFKLPSLTKGLSSQATEAASNTATNFDRVKYWQEFGKNISKLPAQEQVKAIPKFFKELSVETGRPVSVFKRLGFEQTVKRLEFTDFNGGNVSTMLKGLTDRRAAAKAAYEAGSSMDKVLQLLTGIKKSNPMAAARNQAFNEQLHRIGGIKIWDKIVQIYKSPLPTMTRNAAIYSLAKPLLSKLGIPKVNFNQSN